jgi:anti-sigma factor RsiW
MNSTTCAAVQANFSGYLDGAISGHEMQLISRHIEGYDDGEGTSVPGCAACRRELAAWRETQSALCALGPAKAPADLGLRLRVAISKENAKRSSRLADRLSLAWDNAVRPFIVQASGGLVGTILLVGGIALLLGVVAAPKAVLANDEPLGAITPPHYLYSVVAPSAIVSPHDTGVVVVASQLLGSIFAPASAFGIPIRGRVVIAFSGISVRG